MDKKTTDQIIVEYSKKIFGFAMKKSFSYDEAEENDISLETIIDLLKKTDINMTKGQVCCHIYISY